jgi:hypothetical protein
MKPSNFQCGNMLQNYSTEKMKQMSEFKNKSNEKDVLTFKLRNQYILGLHVQIYSHYSSAHNFK